MKRIAAVLGILLALGLIGTVRADHTITVSTSHRVGFHHVLETDDLLILFRYSLVEDLSDEAETAYGTIAATQALYENISNPPVQRYHPPSTGYALGAFYLDATDATAITFTGTDVRVCMEGSPTLWVDPPNSCDAAGAITWENTADQDATLAALASWLPTMLASIEIDDPSIATKELVVSGMITPTGGIYVAEAFPSLVVLLPDIFLERLQQIGQEFDPGTPSAWQATKVAEGTESDFTQGIDSLGSPFGIPLFVMGMVLVLVGEVVLGGFIFKFTGQGDLAMLPLGSLLTAAGMLGLIPLQVAAIVIFLTAIAGVTWAWRQAPS